MIKSYLDYKEYIKADYLANKLNRNGAIVSITWKYLLCLRRLELYTNTGSTIRKYLFRILLRHYSIKTGITIPVNTFGKGLYIPHYGCIVVNGSARFGENCVVQCGVNISEDVSGGDNIYLGAGCKLVIGVRIADYVIIGANAVVTKSIEESNTVWGGIPATKISSNGFKDREIV